MMPFLHVLGQAGAGDGGAEDDGLGEDARRSGTRGSLTLARHVSIAPPKT